MCHFSVVKLPQCTDILITYNTFLPAVSTVMTWHYTKLS